MATAPVTLDPSTAVPLTPAAPSPAASLQGAVSYAAQQDPVKYAKLLQLQKLTGIAPGVGLGNEEKVQQSADVNSINYPQFAAANPRTSAWASDPDNAAVAGVDEIHRLAGMEQNAAVMRTASQETNQPKLTPWADVWGAFKDAVAHPLEMLVGADTPAVTAQKEAGLQSAAQATGDPFLQSVVAAQQANRKPILSVSGTAAFQRLLNPQSQNVFSRAVTGAVKGVEGLTSPDNMGLLAALPIVPEEAESALSGAFSGQMAEGAASAGADAVRAAAKGNYGDAAEASTGALMSGVFAAASGNHALGDNISAELAKAEPSPAAQTADPVAGSPFLSNLTAAVNAAAESPLRERAPDQFYEAQQANFAGDASLRIPADKFQEYFRAQQMDPAAVAGAAGSTNYAEAVLSGGDVEVPPADFLGKLDPEHQKALLPDIVDPNSGLTARQHQEGAEELRQWAANGGPEQLQAEAAQADAQTAATPEWQAVKEDLRQRYVDAGETPEVAETLATSHANVIANLARESGRAPTELMAMYDPKVTVGEAPEMVLHQDAGNAGDVDPNILHQEPLDRAGRQYDSPEMAEARSNAEAAQAAGDAEGAAEWTEKFNDLREGDPRFQKVLAAREAYTQAKDAAAAKPGDKDLARGVSQTFDTWKTEAAKVQLHRGLAFVRSLALPDKSDDWTPEQWDAYQDASEKRSVALENSTTERQALAAAAKKYKELFDAAHADSLNKKKGAAANAAYAEMDAAQKAVAASEASALPALAEPRGWFRVRPDGSFEIGKTKVGDLSTFVHEPAHAYLHMLRDLVRREGASEALKSDWAKVQEFLGVDPEKEGGEALTREQQEKWARANEQYLREGKAPNEGLRGVFQRFAVWLGSIYKKASDLGVELTPEIRGVMDRMYASEEGVNRAAVEAGPHLFTSAEEAGWTPEEFKRYADENNVPVEAAKAHVLATLSDAAVRERTNAWREEAGNVRQAVTEQIDARPEYKAIRGLRKGQLEDGTPLTLSKASLIDQFGEARVQKLRELHPGLYRTEGGVDAETAAEMHGFASAEGMMRTLEATPRRSSAIEQATRAYMTAKYGDIRYDGTLSNKAQLAVETRRANSLYRELKALKAKLADVQGKAASQKKALRDITLAPIEAYRAAAHQMIEKKVVADLQPTRYLDASRKYSREAFDALRKGDAQAAADAKHKELMNHFLFREAADAKEYVGKFEAFIQKRALGRTTQSNLGLAGSDYLAQFNQLLFRYGLGRVPAEATERPLSAWADEMYEAGKEPAIDPAILNEARAISYRNAPLSEVRSLHDALENIKTLAYQEMHVVVNGREFAIAEAKSAMIARARESVKVHPESVFKEDRSLGDATRDLVNRGVAPMIRTEFLMKRLDGGVEGPWHDYLWNLAADAQGVERELQEGVTKVIGDTLQNMPDTQRMRMLDKVTLPGWGEMTRKRLISMALNLGNDGNIDRLRKTFTAFNKDPDAVDRIPKLLTREDWQLVQGLWDSLKPMGQRMNEMERRLTGLPPVMVKPTPLHVELADGTAMDMQGGYYPIAMDPRYSERAQQQDVNVTARNLMESGYGRAATSRGYTKERTGFAGPLLLDHEQVLTQHIAKASKDISHREFILAANRFLQDTDVQRTLRETVGPGYEEQMMPWLRTIVNDRNGSATQGLGDLSNWMGRLRTNVVEASLGFKLSTQLLQITHASSIFLHTSAGSFAQAMVDFLAHPSEMTEQIRNLSPNEMKNRGENIDRDMRSVLQEGIEGRKFGKVVARAGMFPVKMMDHVLSFPLWLAAHRDALAEHADLPEAEAQRLAMHKADGAVRMGLGSNAPKDLPAVMRKNDFWKLVTTLGGFENLKLNQIADASYAVGRDRLAGNSGLAIAGKFTYRMLMAAIVPAVVGAYVMGNRPKSDENSAGWAAKRALLFAPETVPLAGNVVRAIDEHNDAKFTPIINVVDKAVIASVQAGSDKEDKDWTGIGLNAGEAIGQAAGMPGTIQAARTLRYAHRAQMGEINDPNAWDAVVGAPHR